MKKYCANDVAVKKLKLSQAGDAYDITTQGKKVVGHYQGKECFKIDADYFEDNFFPVLTRLK